jgi:hypothetical protein
MKNGTNPTNHLLHVTNFQDLICTPFQGNINAINWSRELKGDYKEIVEAIVFEGNLIEINKEDLLALNLTEQGEIARNVLLEDLKLLEDHGASPTLNIIKYYDRDDYYPFFPTDVYSFHVDRSPVATDTFLCTYFGSTSELIPNEHAIQKITIPTIQEELKKLHTDQTISFEDFLKENFFDLHYSATDDSEPLRAELGHMWRLAVDHPESKVLPCVHRAPMEENGQKRLLLIC